jgi:pimeloyl-ACP methyl ester carboxylesterase
MADHAAALAADGWWAVAPDLPYKLSSQHNSVALRHLVRALRAGALGVRIDRVVLVGFSAGGLSALLAADEPGVVGYIGLDPFDRPSEIGLDAARRLQRPAYLLRGPSAACNAFAVAAPWAQALPQLVEDRQLPEASHCDFEAPTDGLCRLVCGGADPARQAVVRDFVRGAVARLLPPTPAARPARVAPAGTRDLPVLRS